MGYVKLENDDKGLKIEVNGLNPFEVMRILTAGMVSALNKIEVDSKEAKSPIIKPTDAEKVKIIN